MTFNKALLASKVGMVSLVVGVVFYLLACAAEDSNPRKLLKQIAREQHKSDSMFNSPYENLFNIICSLAVVIFLICGLIVTFQVIFK